MSATEVLSEGGMLRELTVRSPRSAVARPLFFAEGEMSNCCGMRWVIWLDTNAPHGRFFLPKSVF